MIINGAHHRQTDRIKAANKHGSMQIWFEKKDMPRQDSGDKRAVLIDDGGVVIGFQNLEMSL
jgi:hypothetical protein